MYERDKHDPPIPRNLPPVAGNITWSRHLLKRIEEPMKQVSVCVCEGMCVSGRKGWRGREGRRGR